MRADPRRRLATLLAAVCLLAAGCDGYQPVAPPTFEPTATRGYVLISIDTLRADHLGAYGYERPTSPFFDQLASRGTLFEHAVIQFPATLISHMSIFTGLYPQEHGVLPPNKVLSPRIETLPERFRAHGFHTAGHTEGAFVAGGFGFRRGFQEFTDTNYRDESDVERTFRRGLRFLSRLEPDERFFVFLHTYTVHDPYDPPEPYRSQFWSGPPPPAFAPTGANLHEVNEGFREVTAEAADYFAALYDAGIRYFDDVLRDFFAELERLGLADETTVVITSDHGEEFLEHGRLVHSQLYPEVAFVPLLFVFPGQTDPVRIDAPVESIDLAPTLFELAGVPPPEEPLSGSSLVPLVTGAGDGTEREAYAEVGEFPLAQNSLVAWHEGELWQVVVTRPFKGEPTGHWYSREVVHDAAEPGLAFDAISFRRPRPLEVLVDGELRQTIPLRTAWTPVEIELEPARRGHRVTLRAEGCQSPARLGIKASDTRCLAFKLRGLEPVRRELFNLSRDPGARHDLSRREPDLLRALLRRLASRDFTLRATAAGGELDPETERTLKALGYLD